MTTINPDRTDTLRGMLTALWEVSVRVTGDSLCLLPLWGLMHIKARCFLSYPTVSAKGWFYRHIGFEVFERTELDEQGAESCFL